MSESSGAASVEAEAAFTALNALGEGLDRQAILERAGRVAAESVGAEIGFVGILDDTDHLSLSGLYGCHGQSLENLRVTRGEGLGGKVVALEQPVSVFDYGSASSISHEYDKMVHDEGIRGMFGVPLVIGGELAGVAYVSRRTSFDCSDAMLDRVLDSVAAAEVALSFADRSTKLVEMELSRHRARAAAALDDELGEHLRGIVSSARSLLADPASSNALVAQADGILRSAISAQGALQRSICDLGSAPEPVSSPLTQRELDVVRLAAEGLSNPEIAERLHLARGTVKSYMQTALVKLDARNRVEAVMTARSMGLI